MICCAESNAILSAYRYHANLTNSTLYTTGYPCHKCAALIVQSGIKTVIYNKDYPTETAIAPADLDAAKKIFFYGKVAML